MEFISIIFILRVLFQKNVYVNTLGKASACFQEQIKYMTTDWFQIGNRVRQGRILSPCLFNVYAEYIMRNARLKHKLESRLPGETSITSDMQMIPPLWQKMKN